MKVGLKSSAITLVAGWWSIGGFVWTLHTLLHNLTGGRFYLQNAQLQGYQAMYFAQNGKLELARAVAIEALKIAGSPPPISPQDCPSATAGNLLESIGAKLHVCEVLQSIGIVARTTRFG